MSNTKLSSLLIRQIRNPVGSTIPHLGDEGDMSQMNTEHSENSSFAKSSHYIRDELADLKLYEKRG